MHFNGIVVFIVIVIISILLLLFLLSLVLLLLVYFSPYLSIGILNFVSRLLKENNNNYSNDFFL